MAEVKYYNGAILNRATMKDVNGNKLQVFADACEAAQLNILDGGTAAVLDTDMVVELVAILNHWLDTGKIEARNG